MWRALPVEWLVAYFVVGSATAFALVWLVQGRPHYWRQKSKLKALRSFAASLSSAISGFALVTALAGKFLWAPLANIPGFSDKVFTDVSGTWAGAIQSNYIDPATGVTAPAVPVEVTIEQDFFTLKIQLVSAGRYTDSRTVAVWADKEPGTEIQRLWYVYEARTRNPQANDSAVHLGAGAVEIQRRVGGVVLDGLYWTNRNWQRRGNTAGTIKLARQPSDQ
jgi:hypothetical protein